MSKHLSYLLIFIFSATRIFGQNTDSNKNDLVSSYPDDHSFYNFLMLDSVEFSLSSPYHTMHTHLENLEEENYHPNISAQIFPLSSGSLKERKQLAIELKLIYTQQGIYINSQDYPLQKNYIDPNTKTHRYNISPRLPNIYIELQDGRWKYSRYSTNLIHQIFEETYPSFARKLVIYTSSLQQMKGKYFGIKLWQWITLVSMLIISYLFYYLTIWFTKRILTSIFIKLKQERIAKKILPKLRRPIAMIILMLAWYYIIPFLLLPSNVSYGFAIITKLIFCFYLIILLFRVADISVLRIGTYSNRSEAIDQNLIPVLKVCFRIIAISAGVLLTLYFFGYDITHIITGISFGGVAIAFAAQDTLKNFIGSVMIFADKPFEVGDWVNIKGQEGIVEEIGFRTTRIRTFTNSLLNIPNGTLSDSDIDNLGKREFRRFKSYLSVPYGTPPDKIEQFIKAIKKAIDDHPQTRKDFYEVRLNKFSASSLDVLLYVFFITRDWSEELQAREYLMIKILRIAETMCVDFAFPTQTIHIANDNNDQDSSDKD
ncbi:mechanosensitive ion channel family protein [Flammeovirga kamogawensis]|uniref:Mechanosensitive ion channel n=1 Tax=Flammeovirga kamogawensis TaxID=373891 RepID=A0ABX8GSL7_9BACT|nr:mechanosensitive ion channel domain-containing protein [Flammeovirga kamogawensis]MBB6463893.1 MscS family membrane protein [Flammeovirga kamogawensis]QWG06583.1 mechanosensitive ion channel [Flammeovirga kamogawensis]TRX68409.1 mechanosensitive ion channel [Flammeovirga kamogawensis]